MSTPKTATDELPRLEVRPQLRGLRRGLPAAASEPRGGLTVAVHWCRFGPYHLARLRAARKEMAPSGIKVVGLETASTDMTYGWHREEEPTVFERHVALPGSNYDRTPAMRKWSGMTAALNRVQPDAMAIAGYSSPDACAALIWCRIHRCPAILMSESKHDDAPRLAWREWLKARYVGQFHAAVCGGKLHRAYLERLGMEPDRVFEGYDAVDNEFFRQGAAAARSNPAAYRHLHGLESPEPFFLASARFLRRKNLDTLLHAYVGYYRQAIRSGKAPWRLVILGDGEERCTLQRIVDDAGAPGIVFAGFRQISDLSAYYGLAGAFVHPARQEQWGLVVNEAMAAGLPVLVSRRCGCVPDLVSEGENGHTFEPDDIAVLSMLLERMSSGVEDLRSMGLASSARISCWGVERFAQGLAGALRIALRDSPSKLRH